MDGWVSLLVWIAVWWFMQRWLFPKLGVPS